MKMGAQHDHGTTQTVDLWQLCPLVRSWISFIVISRFQASEGE